MSDDNKKELTPEEYEKIVRPHFDNLFAAKYDLIVKPNDDTEDSPINISLILRVLTNSLGKLVEQLKDK